MPRPGAAFGEEGQDGPRLGTRFALRLRVQPVPPIFPEGLRVERLGDERLHLKLAGPLPADWPGVFARSCAERGVSLVRGEARRFPDGTWSGRLEVDLSSAGEVDFSRFAVDPGASITVAPPRILDFDLAPSAGDLKLEVHAWDSVGLLAGVIEHVEGVGLQPAGLVLETEAELAFHQLTLVPTAPGLPLAERCGRLRRMLADLVRRG